MLVYYCLPTCVCLRGCICPSVSAYLWGILAFLVSFMRPPPLSSIFLSTSLWPGMPSNHRKAEHCSWCFASSSFIITSNVRCRDVDDEMQRGRERKSNCFFSFHRYFYYFLFISLSRCYSINKSLEEVPIKRFAWGYSYVYFTLVLMYFSTNWSCL